MLILSLFVISLDNTVMNVALPSLVGSSAPQPSQLDAEPVSAREVEVERVA